MIKLLLISTIVALCIASDDNKWSNRLSGGSGCAEHYSGEECDIYKPIRHCADLKQFHGIDKSGYYNISWNKIGYAAEVYCDMDTEGGGWTLMSSAEGAEFANVTYAQYQKPFGGKGKSVDWLGLDNIAAMTQGQETSLRVDLHRCEQSMQYPHIMLTYEKFLVNSGKKGYSVNIPYRASNNQTYPMGEGWVQWDPSKDGPVFSAFDNDKDGCSNSYGRTGFWFQHTDVCKPTNLNGVREACLADNLYNDKLLLWDNSHIDQTSMWLRPRAYAGNIATPSQNENEKISTTISTITPHMTRGHKTRTLPVTTTTTESPTKTTPKPRHSTPPRNPSKTPERKTTTPEEPTTRTPPAKTTTPTVGPTTKTHPTRTFTAPTRTTKGTRRPVGREITKETPVKATGHEAPTTGKRGGRNTTAKKVSATNNHEQPITKTLPTRPSKERLNPNGTPGKETGQSAGETTRRAKVILFPRDGVTLI